MAFTVDDFQDLVSLLEQRPEWRAQLRRLVLTEELLALPATTAGLAEGLRQLQAEVRALAEAQRQTQAELRELAAEVRRLAGDQGSVRDQLNRLLGSDLERRYRDHAGGYFGRLVRRVRVVGSVDLDSMLEEGVAAGALDEEAAQDLRLADLVLRGRRPGEDHDTYLVVEVSVGIGPGDVERAARRAAILGRLHPALAVVAGEGITQEASALTEARGVWHVLDGNVIAPPDL